MKKIKIGIITNENWVDKYTYNLAKWIKLNNKKFEFSSYISVEKKQKKIINNKIFKKIFFRIILIIENFLLKSNKNHHDHLKKFNLEKILKKKILIKIDNNNRLKFNKSDIKKAKKERFDILIRSCSNILSNEFIKISKNGVISFHHGDYEKFRGAPAGFWEVFFKEMKSGFMIQKINENLDYGNIILKGYFQTKAYFLLNQAELYQKSNYYLKKVILDFYNKRKFYFQKKNKKGKVYETPKIMNQIRYLLKTFIFLIKKKFFKKRIFKLAFLNLNQNNSLNLPKNERKKFLADPFLFKRNNRIFCFAEEYDFNRNKGSIICSEISQNNFQRKKTILNEKFHLSFPYIFEYKKKLFMCPDTSEISEIRIYRCLKFPYKWVFHKTLRKNIRSVDSLIFKKNNLWWLFTNIDRSNTGDYNHDLSIFYSKNGPLSQNWKSHPLNPIEIDSSKSRNAGLIFKNNTLFRISQKQGFDNYGEDINFHEIKLLNTKKYNEKKVRYKDFEKIKKKLRNKDIHHFSQLGEKVIVDYK